MGTRWATRIVGGLLACGGLWLAGCTPSSQTAEEPMPDVKVRDIAPPEPIAPPTDEADTGSRLAYRVQRVELDLNRPLNDVWALIDESALSPIQRTVWENNGLRLGRVAVGDIGDVGEAIGPNADTRRSTLVNIDEPAAVRSGPRLARPVPIDLTVPPMNVRREWADSGRFRLLIREAGVTAGGVEIELTPQLYQPAVQLLPRTASQAELDGRLYDTLSATVTLRPRELLVIGLNWPWSVPEPVTSFLAEGVAADTPETPPGGVEDAEAEAAATVDVEGVPIEPAPPTLEAPPLPPSIGRSLFAGERFGRPVQVLLVISVEDGALVIGQPGAP
ncbi:MAG: hypothetical protein AAGK09_12335 [Planctomycetota bacterium]